MSVTATPRSAVSGPLRTGQAPIVAAVLVTVVAWGSSFIGIRSIRGSFDPGALALGRLAVGSLALSLALLARRTWVRPSRREWALVGVCGVLWFGIYNVLINTSERHLDAGTTAMLVNIGPILIALLTGALLGEGFPRWLLIGTGVAFTGVVVMGVATTGAGSDSTGVLLVLLAACAWALGVVAQKPALAGLPALQVTQMACTIGALACLPYAGRLVTNLGSAPTSALTWLIYLGAIPTAVGFGSWAYALVRMPAGRLGVTTYLVPPVAVLGAWPALGETPPPLAVAGGVLALAGVALSRRR